ncbi:MAG: transglutaminase family protein [Deltaproteobacteria bacterium]|nr:transglutaminase family protein [Deltaproteobacteria bacterium]
MDKYLSSSTFIDWDHPSVATKAKELSRGTGSHEEIAKNCFEYVRDKIKHSRDFELNPVTCKASDVLEHKTGYCYAKSHLLAALLRANGIPAGLCYQRLTIEGNQPSFSLHGLNAVYLPDIGWYRIDARGNKSGVEAFFTPPKEKLAFPIVVEGESDMPEIWSEPLPEVTRVLSSSASFQEVADNLPDIEIIKS